MLAIIRALLHLIQFFKWKEIRKLFLLNMNDPRNFDRYKGIDFMKQEQERHLKRYKFRIHPHSRFRVFWETYYCGHIFLTIWVDYLLLILSIVKHKYDSVDPGSFFFDDLIVITNICLNMITGIFVEGRDEAILDFIPIWKKYLKIYFITDLVGLIAGSSVLLHMYYIWKDLIRFKYAFVLQALAILCLVVTPIHYWRNNLCKYYLPDSNMTCSVISFLMIVPLAVACSASICFHAEIEDIYKSADNGIPDVWFYLSEYYKMVVRFWAGVPFPKELAHRLIFVIHVFFIFFPFIKYFFISAFLVILFWRRRAGTDKYNELIDNAHHYLQGVKISDRLKRRILTFYDEIYGGHFYNEPFILEIISSELKEDILSLKLTRVREQIGLISMLPMREVLIVCRYLACEVYFGNDVVVYSGSPHDRMYFIARGSIAIYSNSSQELLHLPNASHFLGACLLTKDTVVPVNFMATETTILYSLLRSDYLTFKDVCPVFYEFITFCSGLLFDDFEIVLAKENQIKRNQEKSPFGTSIT